MKRILLTYIGCMACIFLLPPVLAMIPFDNGTENSHIYEDSLLPDIINVYFAEEGVTRTMELEEYIKGVIPAEMPASFEPEAQKAQAVAARTYVYHKYLAGGGPEHPDAAVCTNPQHCNAYYTKEQLAQKHGQDWIDAYFDKIRGYVDETKGEILVYDNEPILAVFHSASAGGATEASGEVWGKQLPYLVSVKSVGEEQKIGFISTVVVSREDFINKITANFDGASFGSDASAWFGEITRTDAKHVKTVKIGGVEIKGTQLRAMFGLKSTYFDMAADEANITFTVRGSGHGVGMSQYGANYMAQNGADYIEILSNYYSGATVVK